MLAIRKAVVDDAPEILAVHLAAVDTLHVEDRDGSDIDNWSANRTVEHVLKEMQRELFLVAEDKDRIVGFTALDPARAEITSVFVEPALHRTGVGRALVDAIEATARARGLASVMLKATGKAIGFYRRIGYISVRGEDTEPAWAEMTKLI